MSRSGFPAGASLAFFMASSNFLARMSFLLCSKFQESRNLSSRLRCCSFKMPAASVRSTFGPVLGGASWQSTAPKTASTTSFEWQHGQVTFRLSTFCLAMESILRLFDGDLEAAMTAGRSGRNSVRSSELFLRELLFQYTLPVLVSPGAKRS